MPGGSKSFFGFGDAVTEAFVDDQFRSYAIVKQSPVQFERIGDGNTFIEFAMLDERWRSCFRNIGDR